MKKIFALFLLLILTSVFGDNIRTLSPELGPPIDFSKLRRIQAILDKDSEVRTPSEKQIIQNLETDNAYATGSDGCSWYCGGGPSSIYASSFLKPQGNNKYIANNAHDFELRTAWVVGNSGIGEYITFSFAPNSPRVTEFIIYNGYQKSKTVWVNNSRVKKFKLYVNNVLHSILNLKDVTGAQTFTVKPLGSKTKNKPMELKFQIIEVYPGKKWKDTAISEINFSGIDVHCFPAGTLITMGNRSQKPIQDIKVGDSVLSYNEKTKKFENAQVLGVDSVFHENLIEITFDDSTKIISTEDHPYLSSHGWVAFDIKKAERYNVTLSAPLRINTTILDLNGHNKSVKSIKKLKRNVMTYTITRLSKNMSFVANDVIVGVEELR